MDIRLDFLLEGADRTEAEAFTQEYRTKVTAINANIGKRKVRREGLEERITAVHDSARNIALYGEAAKTVPRKLAVHDPVVLWSAYSRLFESVIVGGMRKGIGGWISFYGMVRSFRMIAGWRKWWAPQDSNL